MTDLSNWRPLNIKNTQLIKSHILSVHPLMKSLQQNRLSQAHFLQDKRSENFEIWFNLLHRTDTTYVRYCNVDLIVYINTNKNVDRLKDCDNGDQYYK